MLNTAGFSRNDLARLAEHMVGCVSGDVGAGIQAALAWLQELGQCDHIIVAQFQQGALPTLRKVINYSYDPAWVATYRAEAFDKVDPVLLAANERAGGFSWESAFAAADPGYSRRFLEAMADHGMAGGYGYCYATAGTFPVGVSTVCSLHTDAARLPPAALNALGGLVPAFHAAIALEVPERRPALSARELEVLQWSKDGKTVWEVGRILRLSESTVKFHLRNAYRKLNVSNRAQAIATALKYGLL